MIQNKHIIRFSFIGLFLNIVANIVLYRYFIIEEVVLKQVADQNLHIAETYKNRVWDENRSVINTLQKKSYLEFLKDPKFISFIQDSSGFLKNIGADITLYDHSGTQFLVNHTSNIVSVDEYNSSRYYDKFLMHLDKYFLQNYIIKQPHK